MTTKTPLSKVQQLALSKSQKSELSKELDALLRTLSTRMPAHINNPENRRLEKSLKNALAEYFKDLQNLFPFYLIDKLYAANVKEAALLEADARDILDPVIKTLSGSLMARVAKHLATIYYRAGIQMRSYGFTKKGIPIAYEGPPIAQAIEWAEKYCARLVTKVDDETKKRLSKVIADGINDKRGVRGISKDIRKEFADMSKYRADMIAQTETNFALSTSAFDTMHQLGVDGKEWIVVAPCEDCKANGAQGVIPIDTAFQSGDMTPPAHPNCRCALAPARLSRDANRKTDKTPVNRPQAAQTPQTQTPAADISNTAQDFANTTAPLDDYTGLEVNAVENTDKDILLRMRNSSPDADKVHEFAGGFDRNGKQLPVLEGNHSSVHYSNADVALIKGAKYSLHSHPSGCPFSSADLAFFSQHDVQKGAVISEKYKYELMRADKTKPWPLPSRLMGSHDYLTQTLLNQFRPLFNSSGNTIASQELYHEVMQRLAKRYNLIYTRTVVK